MVQTVKNLPVKQQTWFRSLSREDPLKKDVAPHSSVSCWRIPWTEEPGGPQGRKELNMTEQVTLSKG